MTTLLGYLAQEATVVGIFCLIFLVLFVVAGVRQAIKRRD